MDDEIDIELRPPQDVARRAIVLTTLLRRIALENLQGTGSREAEDEAFDLREWLQVEGLRATTTEREAAILAAPCGSLGSEWVAEFSWQGEALAALLWALGHIPAPLPVDSTFHLDITGIPAPWDSTVEWVSTAQLRAEETIANERERAEIWHWRLVVEALRRAADGPELLEIQRAIAEVVTDAIAVGLLAGSVTSDFAVAGAAMREIPETTLDSLTSTWEQRLWALNWAVGFGSSWDDVPLDV